VAAATARKAWAILVLLNVALITWFR